MFSDKERPPKIALKYWPDRELNIVAMPVPRKDYIYTTYAGRKISLAEVIDIIETRVHKLYASNISGPQIGIPLRIISLNLGNGIETYINPQIVGHEGNKVTKAEGCLSAPGVTEAVLRYEKVYVKALTKDWKEVDIVAEGFRAQAFQHEIEHLDGRLFLDTVPPPIKDRAVIAIRKSLLSRPVKR